MPTKYGSSEPNRVKHSEQHASVECVVGGTPIETNKYIQSFQLVEKAQGSYEAEFVFFDYEWDVLEEFLLRKGMGTPVDFRFGFRDRQSQWFRMLLADYTPSFSNQGVVLTVPLKDGASLANKKTRSMGYSVDRFPTISSIVEWICEQNNWPMIVEPTKPHQNPITQDNMADTHLLMHKLKDQAVNLKGIGGYVCYFEAGGAQSSNPLGILHFHTPTYPKATKQEIYKTYNFAKELDGEVLEFTPKDNTSVVCMAGGKDANYECFDPRTKRRTTERRRTKDFEGRPMIGEGSVAEPTDEPGMVNRWVTRPFDNPDELKRYAESRWAMFNNTTFTATLKLLGDPFISPLMFVRVNVIMRNGKIHDRWSGRYLVNSATHEIEAGRFTTTLELLRESAGKTDGGGELSGSIPSHAAGGGNVKLEGGKYAFARETSTVTSDEVSKGVKQA
jgi:hypothetical protein